MNKVRVNGDKFILGIYYESHDTGAALIDMEGNIVAAINEERLSRNKEETAVPLLSIKAIFEMTGLNENNISIVAFSGEKPGMKKTFDRYFTNYLPEMIRGFPQAAFYYAFGHAKPKYHEPELGSNVSEKLEKIYALYPSFRNKSRFYDHHMTHLASGYFTCGKDNALLVSLDGVGDNKSGRIAVGKNGKIIPVAATPWPHSSGQFYKLVTEMLGFRPRRHAGKITGLAAYGNQETACPIVKKLMYNQGLQLKVSRKLYTYKWHYRRCGKIHPDLASYSREDLAAAFQRRLEEVAVELVRRAVKKTGVHEVVLSGGVCANVKMNQRIRELPEVSNVFIHQNMGDGGICAGAALLAWSKYFFNGKIPLLKDVYLGPSYSNAEIEEALKKEGIRYKKVKDAEKYIAELISKKKIVGRFAGRMEYGPRALGNRSILAEPTDKTINDWLNKRLNRTEFMPFAPSTLDEDGKKYYKNYSDEHFTAQFMTITYDVTDKGAKEAGAVTHVDQTARPQIVTSTSNPGYYKILQHYKKMTSMGCFVNTSFNMHEEPIVCSPYDAIRAFKEGSVDVLALENYIVDREEQKGIKNG